MTDLSLTDETIRAAVVKTVPESIDDAKREELLKGAIASLLAPDSGIMGRRSSRLQEAFEQAVFQAFMDICREELKKPEYQEQIMSLFREGFESVVQGSRDDIADRIAHASDECVKPSWDR